MRFSAVLLGAILVVALTGSVLSAPDTEPASAERPTQLGPVHNNAGGSGGNPAGEAASTCLWHNFSVMMKGTWKDIAYFAGKVVIAGILGGILFFLIGAAVGCIVYLLVRRRSVLDAPFSWYRYVRWAWCPVFILTGALGVGYAGVFLGGGLAIKHAIASGRIVERVVANGYCVLAFDSAEYELKGQESAAEIEAVLEQSEGLAEVLTTDLGQMVKEMSREAAKEGTIPPERARMIEKVADSRVGEMTMGKIGESPSLVILMFYAVSQGGDKSQEFLQTHPKATPLAAAFTRFFQKIREELCSLVNSLVYPHALLGILLGLSVPFLLVALFRIGVWFYVKRSGNRGQPVDRKPGGGTAAGS